MTVTANDRRSPVYACTGGETVLGYDFKIVSAADLAVWRLRGGGITRLALSIDYAVAGVGLANGSNVTLLVPAVDGDKYLLMGDTAPVRLTDFVYTQAIPPSALNNEYDHLQRQLAEIRAELARKLGRSGFDERTAKSELPATGIGYLYLDDQGNLQLLAGGPGGGGALTLPLSVAQGGTGADDAAEARTNLGLGAIATRNLVAAVDMVSGVVRFDVESHTVTAPPGSPADGQMWIIPTGATGAWANKTHQIARWIAASSAWAYLVPAGGWTAYAKDTQSHLDYTPSYGWAARAAGGGAASGVADGRIVGRFGGNGQSGVAVRGWWTADNRIFIAGVGTGKANADPSEATNWFPLQVPWDGTLGIGSIVSSGHSHYLIDANDDVWVIGGNTQGQLGLGDTTARWRWTRLEFFNGINIAEVIPSRSNAGTYETTFFREKDGDKRVWGVGNNTNYVLGDNTTTQRTSPVRVGTLTDVVEVAFDHVLGPALFRVGSGAVYVTGGPGGLANGLGTAAAAQVPTEIPAIANEGIVKMRVGAGGTSGVAAVLLKSNGTPLVAGKATWGLGLGNTTDVTTFTPITPIPDGEVLVDVEIVGGAGIVLAFRSSAKNLHIAGYGGNGIRGDASTSNMLSLVKPGGAFQGAVDEIRLAGAEGVVTVAVRAGAVLWTCGADATAQTAQGDYNLGAAARQWRTVQGLDGTIVSWGWHGAPDAAGLSVVLADGRAKGAGANASGQTGTQPGNLHVVATLQDVQGLPDLLIPGPAGPANVLTIGTVTTLAAGASATASVAGAPPAQALSLGIPRGADATVAIGATTTVTPAAGPSVANVGTPGAADLRFSLPRARSVTVGSTTTGAAGSSAAVVATLDGNGDVALAFTIPTGPAGPTGPGYGGTSSTSLTLGTGTKSLTTAAGLAYVAGQRLRLSTAAGFMEGACASYNPANGALSVEVLTSGEVNGSGTHASWTIGVAGLPGVSGSTPGGSSGAMQYNAAGSIGGASALSWNETDKTLEFGGATNRQFMELVSTVTGGDANFAWVVNTNPQTNGPGGNPNYTNHVVAWGWNHSATVGYPADVTKIMVGSALEFKYYQAGTFAAEYHLVTIRDTGGNTHRALTFFLPHDGGAGSGSDFAIDYINFLRYDATQVAKWTLSGANPSLDLVAPGHLIRKEVSGQPFLQQKNAAGSAFLNLPYINADNHLLISQGINVQGVTGASNQTFAKLQCLTAGNNHTLLAVEGPGGQSVLNTLFLTGGATSQMILNQYNQTANGQCMAYFDCVGASGKGSVGFRNFTTGVQWSSGLDGATGKYVICNAGQVSGGTEALTITNTTRDVGIGTTSPTTKLHVNGPVRVGSYTAATLPSASAVGAFTIVGVTDANATTPRSTVAGGGANNVIAFSDGTNWLIAA